MTEALKDGAAELDAAAEVESVAEVADGVDCGRAAPARRRGARLERTTHHTSRLLDFCTEDGLIKQTGHKVKDWPLVILKELVDNSLDACDEKDVAPVIDVRVHQGGITVADNGPGIPEKVVDAILDFSIRVSRRAAYVAPDRGAQGNAAKTIVAMPYVLDGKRGCVRIISKGKCHKILFGVDPIREEPVVDHQVHGDQLVKNGTVVAVRWPNASRRILQEAEERFLQIAESYAVLNPHLTLSVDWFGERTEFEATDPSWSKWRPSDPTCIHWYGLPEFERLILSHIKQDRKEGRDRTVRDFAREFRGLTGSVKQKVVLDATGLSGKNLSALVDRDELDHHLTDRLLAAMKERTKLVKPKALGIIGSDHLQRRFEQAGCVRGTFKYKRETGTIGGIPWVVEAAFAWWLGSDDDDRKLIAGVNWSPALLSPFRELGRRGVSLDTILSQQYVDDYEPVAVFVHMARPGFKFLDQGKSSVVVMSGYESAGVIDAVRSTTTTWKRQREAEEKDRQRRAQRKEKLTRQRFKERHVSIKQAAYEIMEEAYMKASDNGTLPTKARQIMYAARDYIQKRSGKELIKTRQRDFTQIHLPNYIKKYPEKTADWDVIYDARGNLTEPHTGRSVPLGTEEVRNYLVGVDYGPDTDLNLNIDLPDWFPTYGPQRRYGAILFIEKEGFGPLLKAEQIANRYDIAIMSPKGVPTTACRHLIDEICAKHDVPVYVLHDFDVKGFEIIGVLRNDTRRYEFRNKIEVIDLGVRLADIQKYDLPSEKVSYGKSNPTDGLVRNDATQVEVKFLVRGREGTSWIGRRVELNAFTSREFIGWIEGNLIEHGVAKVVPDDDTLATAYQRIVGIDYIREHSKEIAEAGRRHAAAATIPPADLRESLAVEMEKNSAVPWDIALGNLMRSGNR